jgi:hypothetical protein
MIDIAFGLIGTLTVSIDPAIDAESAPSTRRSAGCREEINQKPIGDASTDAGRLCGIAILAPRNSFPNPF